MRPSCFLFIFSISIFKSLWATSVDCQLHKCVAVIDAGSTKSYLHVYQFDIDQTHTPSHIEEITSNRVTPGLANVDPQNISTYISKLLEPIESKNIPIYLYATAGMRLLPINQQQNIYKSIHDWFDQHPEYRLQTAETISGKREAIYDWVSANYQLGLLSQPNQKLTGVMDMGGASVQIAYPITQTDNIPASDLETVYLYNKKFTIFVHSFLGLGQTEVMHQLLDEPGCYPIGLTLSDQSLGTGQAEECANKVDILLNLHKVFPIVHPTDDFEKTKSWYVMGGLSALSKTFAFNFEKQILQPKSLMDDGVDNFCHTTWSKLSTEHPNDAYMATNCLSDVYFHSLLVKGYGFSEQQDIQFSQNGPADDWTMGVILVELSH